MPEAGRAPALRIPILSEGSDDMLEQMRKHMNWILWATLGLIIVTFLFFGIYPTSTSDRVAAKVNDDIITFDEWNRLSQNLADTYRQIFRDQFNEDMRKMLRQQAIQELIQNRLLSQEAERMGIRVSDKELQRSILEIPAFNANGRFDKRAYEYYLNRFNLTPATFESSQRDMLRRQRLVRMIEDSVDVTDAEVVEAMAAARPKVKAQDLAQERKAMRQQLLTQKRQEAVNVLLSNLRRKALIRVDERIANF